MNRRRFLNLIAGAGTAAALPPSMVWPFRKIFLPSQPKIITAQDFAFTPDKGITYFCIEPPPSYHDFFGLKRIPYPGQLIHEVVDIDHENKVITFRVGRT